MELIAVCSTAAAAKAVEAGRNNCITLVEPGGPTARRAAGLARARADFVAVMNEDYRPGPDWADAALAFDNEADVLVGEVHPATALTGARRAAFYWEYAHWAPAGRRMRLDAEEARLAPAGAVIYRRLAVDARRLAQARDELEYHAAMFAAGARFVREPRLRLYYAAPPLSEFLGLRAQWSTEWARAHVGDASTGARRLKGIARLGWPPLALLRFARRAAGAGAWRAEALASLPYAALFACAEGWGELRGCWGRRG